MVLNDRTVRDILSIMNKSNPYIAFALHALLVSIAFVWVTVGTGCTQRVSDETIQPITTADLQRRIQDKPNEVLMIDARSADAFAQGHIPGAVHMTLPQIDPEQPDPQIQKYKTVIVYGQNPGSVTAKAMVKRFMKTGVKNARLLEGGIDAWRARGLPITSSD